jgi:broad specificity phosphatase PhoE
LIVVRHGETEWNKTLRVQGVTDVPLNAKGTLQAQTSAQALLEELQVQVNTNMPSVIYSSAMRRASDTAQAIADALNKTVEESKEDIVISKHGALNEWNLGVLEGLRKEEAMARYPDDWKIFSEWADPLVSREHAKTAIMGGESMEDLRMRAVGCLEQLIGDSNASKDGESPVVVVTHGGVLGQLLRHVLVSQYPLETHQEIRNVSLLEDIQRKYHRPKNACITRFEIDTVTKEWNITDWANASHLVGEAAPIDTNYKGETSTK